MKRRTYSAAFKARIVLEVLKGEKELNTIAAENEIAPNQIRNWKTEFLKNASAAFEDNKTKKLREELHDREKENDRLYTKIGKLTTEVEWLKKNPKKHLDLNGRTRLLREARDKKELPLSTIANLLDVNRTSAYYHKMVLFGIEIAIKDKINGLHMDNPIMGIATTIESTEERRISNRKTEDTEIHERNWDEGDISETKTIDTIQTKQDISLFTKEL